VKEAAEMFDMKLLDHLIVTSYGYSSYADEGVL
jgi:DNA repair protein RadC